MKKLVCLLLIAFQAAGCSTSGGMYKSGDSTHGELSVGRTAVTVLGVLGAAAAIRKGGGGGADRNTDMRGTTSPETDSGYVGISLTGSTQGKKTVLAALW